MIVATAHVSDCFVGASMIIGLQAASSLSWIYSSISAVQRLVDLPSVCRNADMGSLASVSLACCREKHDAYCSSFVKQMLADRKSTLSNITGIMTIKQHVTNKSLHDIVLWSLHIDRAQDIVLGSPIDAIVDLTVPLPII